MMTNDLDNWIILAARVFLAALFLVFGVRKLEDISGTVSQMAHDGLPTPVLASTIAIFMELPVAFAVALGAFTRFSAILMFLYTLGTSLIEHRYWTLPAGKRVESMEAFYKNLCIMGGFLLLTVAGAGRYSIDAAYGLLSP